MKRKKQRIAEAKRRKYEREYKRKQAERKRREREKTECYKKNGYSDLEDQKQCVKNKLWETSSWWPYLDGLLAMYKMYSRIEKDSNYALSGGRSQSKGPEKDALRHMWMQGLLCKYYIGDKRRRINFAMDAGDFWEDCGNNEADDSQMDLHNNAIGRDIFDRLAEDVNPWWCLWLFCTDIDPPYDYEMKREAERLLKEVQNVEENILGKDRLKYDGYDKLPDNLKICNRKHWIKYEADKNKPVILKTKE